VPNLPDNATLLQLLQSQGINYDQMQKDYQSSHMGVESAGGAPASLPSPSEVVATALGMDQLKNLLWSLPWLEIASFVGCVLNTMAHNNPLQASIQHCAASKWPLCSKIQSLLPLPQHDRLRRSPASCMILLTKPASATGTLFRGGRTSVAADADRFDLAGISGAAGKD
jgi:hypothetical protein